MIVIALFVAFVLLILLEVPVAFAMILAVFGSILTFTSIPVEIVVQRMPSGIDSFPLLAIPLFILAGNVMNGAGIANRIYDFSMALVGHIRGGLGHVNILGSMIFAGMSGVAQADAAGLGTIEIKHMKERGYDPAFAAACTAASAIIGPIIPPSVIMVVYAVTAEVSLTDLFLAGIVPGILLGLTLMALVYVQAARGKITAPVEPRSSMPQLGIAFVRALPALAAPTLLTLGLLSGAATPTELGALTVVYAVVLGFLTRDLTVRALLIHMRDSAITTGILTFIIAAAVPFGWLISVQNVSAALQELMSWINADKYTFLMIINLILLVAGLFMETTAILLIATPALLPVIKLYEIDPVHFGLGMILNLLIGAITPPFGVILFICKHIAEITFEQMVKATLPFYVPLALMLLVITYVPQLSLWLPSIFK